MRLVFMGSGAFATPALEALLQSDHEVVLVFTQPDRHAGRGQHTRATPVKDAALALDIPVFQPDTLKGDEATGVLKEAAPELAVVVAYGHLIPAAMLAVPDHGFINAHASLLPKYRGAAPVPHAILAGEEETGVTVFQLNARFDAGAILGTRAEPIAADDTTGSLLSRLAPVAADLVLEVIGQLAAGWAQPLPQTEAQATKAPKLTKAMGAVDWQQPAAQIERQIRAFQPWPLAYTFLADGKRRQRLAILAAEPQPPYAEASGPGTIVDLDPKAGVTVQCGDAPLRLITLKPEGKRAMSSAEFARGARLAIGTRFE